VFVYENSNSCLDQACYLAQGHAGKWLLGCCDEVMRLPQEFWQLLAKTWGSNSGAAVMRSMRVRTLMQFVTEKR
jgi:hypothetical protein